MGLLRKKLTVMAVAKINLHLEVLDRLQSGFHNIESIFLALDFGDILHFELVKCQKTTELAMKGLNFALPPIEKNIVFRSLRLFREKTGFSKGLNIIVEKRVPAGGGLGGGSSDAAATLLALNRLAGFPLNQAALLETAAALGSDVPFFIYRTSAARVTGSGDIIEPFEAPPLFFVLVNPGFPSDTAAAYRLLDEYRERIGREELTTELHGGEKEVFSDPAQWSFKNDFLPVFGERER